MRFFAFVLFLQVSNGATGFSPVVNSPNPPRAALFAATANQNDFDPRAVGIALTLALDWAVGSSPSLAVPSLADPSPSHHFAKTSSTFIVALSDSDFADFSLPSYAEVSAAGINTNLKGSKTLFSDSFAASSVTGSVAEDSPKSAQPSAADLIAEKAAAKAAQKAARASQLAAVEAAASAK